MPEEYIHSIRAGRRIPCIGNKANSLRILAEGGFPTPATYVCTWGAYLRYAQGDLQVIRDLRSELSAKLNSKKSYAVRSSANVEDGLDMSFAGQFETVLGVWGVDAVLEAIRLVWETTQSPAIQAYLGARSSGIQDLKMAVIIQEMVSAKVSGVAFSKNPTTGLDEVLVEAVRGSGQALVQDGVTPQRWINKWGTWTERPCSPDSGQGIPLDLIDDVVRQTKQIASKCGRPVDLEWVYDGRRIQWVQMREITTLHVPVFSNRVSNEVFPGVIKPLVWSVNVPLVNGAWVALFTELIGPNDIQPEALAGRFYCRAYFDMAAVGRVFELLGLPRETLELLMGIDVEGPERPSFRPSRRTYMLLPRLLRFGLNKARFGRRIEAFLPVMKRQFQLFVLQDGRDMGPIQLLEKIDGLAPLVQKTAYYNTVTALLMRVYSGLLRRQLRRLNIDFEAVDMTSGDPARQAYDPNLHLARLAGAYLDLGGDLQARVGQGSYEQLSAVPGTETLQSGIAQFLRRFGHLSDSSSDFSQAPWRENPDLVLKMIIDSATRASGSGDRVQFGDLQIPILQQPLLKALCARSRRFHRYREAVSSLYTYGYGLFRDLFLALGDRFVGQGLIGQAENIFYLYMDEIRDAAKGELSVHDLGDLVKERKDELDRSRGVIPPDTIFGGEAPALVPDAGRELKGTPTSRGTYTGPVRVLEGVQEIGKMQEGDVLVIPYSDVGWTPLFTKAGAVVAESGGILSHSSIIAREYGIPAVVSVPGACQLTDNTLVTVNGHNGNITVHGLESGSLSEADAL